MEERDVGGEDELHSLLLLDDSMLGFEKLRTASAHALFL